MLAGLLAACGLVPGAPAEETATLVASVPAFNTRAAPTALPATETSTAVPSATATPVPTVTPTPAPPEKDLSLEPDDIFIFPGPQLYSGDSVTFQVVPSVPEEVTPEDVTVQIVVQDRLSLHGALNRHTLSLSANPAVRFTWAWETHGEVGNYQVTVTLDPEDSVTVGDANPDNNQVTLTVPILPARSRPAREQNAAWITTESDCCILHVVSGTSAHRDLNQLKAMAEEAVQHAAEGLGEEPQKKIDLYFIDRVIGQGGYAGSNMVISYLDRNYVGDGVYEVLVHETVHLLDWQFAPNRISFLAEGLAVWVTGGHYKQEDIDQRLFALRETGLYLPLPDLINDFYEHQHEIGYLEAAGFINYLVNNYGWERVRAFYSDVDPLEGQSDAGALDTSLRAHFGQSLAEAESAWMAYLDTQSPNSAVRADLLATVRYYDLMRAYQLQYDPTAHFLQAWLPIPHELEQRQLTAELSRHPNSELNITLEVMFSAVDRALRAGDSGRANVILDSIERALANNGVFADPLGTHYQEIVRKLSAVGYEVHQVSLSGNQAEVQVTEGRRVYLKLVTLYMRNRAWILAN